MICFYIYNLNIMNLLIGEGNLITNLFFQQESFKDTDKNWPSVPLPRTVTTMGGSLEWYPRTKTLCRSKHRYITQELYIPRISQHFASLHWQWCLYVNEILSNRTLHDMYGHVINILILKSSLTSLWPIMQNIHYVSLVSVWLLVRKKKFCTIHVH